MTRVHPAQPLTTEYAELVARRFGALAEPMRVRLLDALRRSGEASVQELAESLEASHANVSKHLGVLHAQRIVGRRKAGTRAMYRVSDQGVLALCDQVCGGIQDQLRELIALVEAEPLSDDAPSARQPDRSTAVKAKEKTR